ncbi:MAG: translation initiation factor IF-2 [Verrucomicrobiota bacterium]
MPAKKRSTAPRKGTTPAEKPEGDSASSASETKDNKPTLDEQKKEALSLFEKEDKGKGGSKKVTTKTASEAGILPPISKLADDGKKPTATKPEPPAEAAEEGGDDEDGNIIHIKPPIIVKDLADRMKLKPFKIIGDLMKMDVFASPDSGIEPDVAAKVCELHGFVFEREKREKGAGVHKVEEVIEEPPEEEEVTEDELKPRPPIVTVMGHVDHGKTSLLDAIRKSRVVQGEAGGITQHINAYAVDHDGKTITFIDTPGHAAFTAMRARGADVTDIVILVIAADDGIMPTTKEAISHAQAAEVPIIIAINKIDVKNADVMKVMGQLQKADLTPEDLGGEVLVAQTSAVKGDGVSGLLDMVNLQAEILELKANPEGIARAMVVESSTKAGKGNTASVIVQNGTLKVGTPFICGPHWGKVKGMFDDQGEAMKKAGPSLPVELLGFNGLPNVGDEVVEMGSEREAKKLSDERLDEARREKLEKPQKARLNDFMGEFESAEKKKLKVVLKTDVQGSLQALLQAFEEFPQDKIELDILHSAAGPISESDVLLSSASNAVIIGFNVKVENKAVKVAKSEGVEIKLYSVIYELLDQVKEAMSGLLDPETRENVIGHAEVLQVFKIARGRVAGCRVKDGRLDRNERARVLRDGVAVFDGDMNTLRRFQDEVDVVKSGLECGVRVGEYREYQEGDEIECYTLEKLEVSL